MSLDSDTEMDDEISSSAKTHMEMQINDQIESDCINSIEDAPLLKHDNQGIIYLCVLPVYIVVYHDANGHELDY